MWERNSGLLCLHFLCYKRGERDFQDSVILPCNKVEILIVLVESVSWPGLPHRTDKYPQPLSYVRVKFEPVSSHPDLHRHRDKALTASPGWLEVMYNTQNRLIISPKWLHVDFFFIEMLNRRDNGIKPWGTPHVRGGWFNLSLLLSSPQHNISWAQPQTKRESQCRKLKLELKEASKVYTHKHIHRYVQQGLPMRKTGFPGIEKWEGIVEEELSNGKIC